MSDQERRTRARHERHFLAMKHATEALETASTIPHLAELAGVRVEDLVGEKRREAAIASLSAVSFAFEKTGLDLTRHTEWGPLGVGLSQVAVAGFYHGLWYAGRVARGGGR